MAKELNYNRVLLKKVLSRFRANRNQHSAICIEAMDIADFEDSMDFRWHMQQCLLGKYVTVYSWLKSHVGVPSAELTPENLQEYRIRWMEHMLKNDPFFASQKAD
jgi:hypothetical protein